eukprot:scaffold319600_cov15-Tisochrysis_lutea.AAC.1
MVGRGELAASGRQQTLRQNTCCRARKLRQQGQPSRRSGTWVRCMGAWAAIVATGREWSTQQLLA